MCLVGEDGKEFADVGLARKDIVTGHVGLTGCDAMGGDQQCVVRIIGHNRVEVARRHRLHMMIQNRLRGIGSKCHTGG